MGGGPMKSYKWPIILTCGIIALALVEYFWSVNLMMEVVVNGEKKVEEDPLWLLIWRIVIIVGVAALWMVDIWFYNKRQREKVVREQDVPPAE
jgi:NADH:ubiquinone oxidoreductase subunit 5 (subunit L)/multisubunit Na+/H+ antiporter MnhA subunit